MGVSYYSCSVCGKVFSDHSDYFGYCDDCGRRYCSETCANRDELREYTCTFGNAIHNGQPIEECSKTKDGECYDCDYYHENNCKYCRKEDFKDSELLEFAMKLLKCDRGCLINKLFLDEIEKEMKSKSN